jgi:hypothetical protein
MLNRMPFEDITYKYVPKLKIKEKKSLLLTQALLKPTALNKIR